MERTVYDSLIHRCPSLGGEAPFQYCRKMNQGGPCSRFPLCWGEEIDIFGYIREFYTREEIEKYLIQPGAGRLGHILGQLERIEKMKDEKENMREELIKAIREKAQENKITCANAWSLAERYGFSRPDMGQLLNELKIKIVQCQLGCF